MATPEIATIYLAARQRIDDLVRPLEPAELARPSWRRWTGRTIPASCWTS
ncbi:hypothetical protein NHL50_17170 [Acidimicrobiia bacterium EGI L10123]|nr:hypothetical protein [Acidimicrobiia bacterium EGI L10123]